MPAHATPAVYAKLVGVALIWGGTFIAGRVAAAEMHPSTAALWRYLFASVTMLAAARLIEGPLPALSLRQWVGVALLGATGVAAYNLCFMYGLERVPAGRASLIVALNPAFILLGSIVFFGERLDLRRGAGILLALAGAAVVIGHGDPLAMLTGGMSSGDVIILGCVVSWASFTLIGKRMMAGMSPIALTTYASLAGTAMLALATFATGGTFAIHPSAAGWMALAFLGVFGTGVAFVWYTDGVRRIGAPNAAIFINLVPVAAVALGVLMLGETPEPAWLSGGLLVLAGVWLINRAPRRASLAQP
jgi:drug/metabolite transporter (DMT)-like permease